VRFFLPVMAMMSPLLLSLLLLLLLSMAESWLNPGSSALSI
jgi:hypothetical protein